MSKLFPRLNSPVGLRGRTLRNRIVFGAHTANMARDGMPTEQHVAYYEERAIGGAAMIVVEPMPVHPAAGVDSGQLPPRRRRRHSALQACDRGDQGQRRRRDPADLPCRRARGFR